MGVTGSRMFFAAFVAAAALFLFSSPAGASSIVWTQDDGNVYIDDRDTADAPRKVTADGTPGAPYKFASQADDGTIVAVKPGPPDRIVVLTPAGVVTQSFLPTQLPGGILSARVSPDASKIAFETFFLGAPGCAGGTTGPVICSATFVVSSTGADIDAAADWVNPEWISSSRLAVVRVSGFTVGTFDPAPGRVGEPATWWDFLLDPSYAPGKSIGDIAVSSDGTSVATSIQDSQGHLAEPDILRLWATVGDPAAGGLPAIGPTAKCDLTGPTGGLFRSPSWSPDSGRLVYEETDGEAATDAGQEGIWVVTVPALATIADCGTVGIAFAVDDAHHPSWGLAGAALPDGGGGGGGGDGGGGGGGGSTDSKCVVPKAPKGASRKTVTAKLTDAGCTLGKVTKKFSRTVKRGKLIKLRARAGTELAAGAAVDAIFSKGKPRK